VTEIDPERARLRWRCRRGMRELDQLLIGWLDQHWLEAGQARRDAFRRLLQCEDDLIWRWCTGAARPENPALAALIDELGR